MSCFYSGQNTDIIEESQSAATFGAEFKIYRHDIQLVIQPRETTAQPSFHAFNPNTFSPCLHYTHHNSYAVSSCKSTKCANMIQRAQKNSQLPN